MGTKRIVIETEREVCDRVFSWMEQYAREVETGPVKFALVSRRWAWAARRFGRPLLDILSDDERFVSSMGKGGDVSLIARTPEQIEQARLIRRLMEEPDEE